MKKYGTFYNNGYKITDRNTPRHWNNILFNDEYVASVSQVAAGFACIRDESEGKLTVLNDRAIYIYDGERAWQANGLPIQKSLQHYHCLHGIGYTEIEISHRAVRTNCRFFVPRQGKCEYLCITVKNEARHTKTLKVLPYYATCADNTSNGISDGCFLEEKNGIVGTFKRKRNGSDSTYNIYLTAPETVTGYDACHSAFIGPYGHKLQPKAIVEHSGCTNSICISDKICFALENSVTLAAGESKTFYYSFGIADSPESIPQADSRLIERAFVECTQKDLYGFDTLRIHTPWDELDKLCNDWLKYQCCLSSHWGDVDKITLKSLFGNCETLSSFNATHAGKQLCKTLVHQSEHGQLPSSTECNDCISMDTGLWAVYAAFAITKELGDVDYLLQKVPFSNGENATVYEHLKRALAFLWKCSGHMGLIKHRIDDKKSADVWVSIAFVRAAKMLSQMANWIGNSGDSKTAAYYAQEMEKRVYQYAWDDDRYVYAVTEDKQPIGAALCSEGAIFALPQIWTVLSEFEDSERRGILISTLERELNTEAGLLFCKPPFTQSLDFVDGAHAGVNKNGGIHLQTAIWKLVSDCIMKRSDQLEEGLRKILPALHPHLSIAAEPYALCDYYFGKETEHRYGQAGPCWTGQTGQWLLYCLVKYIYGLQPEFGGLRIQPCLPVSWKDCSVSKVFRECRYNIHYTQRGKGAGNVIDGIYVNGVQVNPALPIRPQKGKTINVEVILKS